MAYRQTGPSTYERVPGSAKYVTLSLRCPTRQRGNLPCSEMTLPQREQFNIQQNDVVAACLLDSTPIRVIGEDSSPSTKEKVYRFEKVCSYQQLQSIDTQSTAFSLDNGLYRLHLYAVTDSKLITNKQLSKRIL